MVTSYENLNKLQIKSRSKDYWSRSKRKGWDEHIIPLRWKTILKTHNQGKRGWQKAWKVSLWLSAKVIQGYIYCHFIIFLCLSEKPANSTKIGNSQFWFAPLKYWSNGYKVTIEHTARKLAILTCHPVVLKRAHLNLIFFCKYLDANKRDSLKKTSHGLLD